MWHKVDFYNFAGKILLHDHTYRVKVGGEETVALFNYCEDEYWWTCPYTKKELVVSEFQLGALEFRDYSRGQEILITHGKNKGKTAIFLYFIDDDYLLYSLTVGHRARIKIEHTEHYVRKFKGVPVTELCSVCWV